MHARTAPGSSRASNPPSGGRWSVAACDISLYDYASLLKHTPEADKVRVLEHMIAAHLLSSPDMIELERLHGFLAADLDPASRATQVWETLVPDTTLADAAAHGLVSGRHLHSALRRHFLIFAS